MFFPLKDDNPTHRIGFQYVTVAVLAACVLVWLIQLLGGNEFDNELMFRLGMIPVTILGEMHREPDLITVPPWLTLFTSMFLHGGFMHLLGNMLYLWIFGDNVEDAMGHWRFAFFYLLCGVIAGLAHAVLDPTSQIPAIGASGAISGVLGAYLMLHPKRGVWILIFFMPIRFPAWGVLGAWIGYQIFNAVASDGVGGGVAWYAHIGGFVAGALLVIPVRKRGVPLFDNIPIGPWNRRSAWPPLDSNDDARWGDFVQRRPREDAQDENVGPWGRRPRRGRWSRRD